MSNLTFDRGVWHRIIALEKECKRLGSPCSRKVLQDALGCSISQARLWDFAIKHKDIIRHKPSSQEVVAGERVVGLFDIHIPYQDDAAVEAALSYMDEFKPTIIVLGGDIVDFYQISTFIKDPRRKGVDAELKQCKLFLQDLRKRFPDTRIIYMEGNHEYRMEAYILRNAKEIYSLVEDLIPHKMGFAESRIEYMPSFFQLGKLWFLHGHERPAGGDPEYITNVVFKYVLDHFICGHHHRAQEKIFKRISGATFWGGACGYLAGYMDYAKLNKWSQSFVTVVYGAKGNFSAEIKKIEDGEIY